MNGGTVSAERVLVDTSVWVAFFRGADPEIAPRLEDLIRQGHAGVPALVLAELIQGAKSESEIRTFEDLRDSVPVIAQGEGSWLEAGRLSYALKKRGKTIHLTDCLIAVIARENGCGILTRDAHFRDIRAELDIEAEIV